ncbi:MAG: hypothetical protein OQJ89_00990, partial [Kangiellaceae bacterium]|nr:hypothetical protein [Kangiellaceae bacterium]
PHIRLDNSPFYIHGKTQKWEPLVGDDERELPRRAGVSSFSFGGANAHLILEEFQPSLNQERSLITNEKASEFIFPLSAKSVEQLRQKAIELRSYLVEKLGVSNSIELDSLAYTLQVGREPMEYRVSFLANSTEQLIQRIERFISEQKSGEGICQGSIKDDKESISLISKDEDIKQALVEKLMKSNKLSSLSDMWVKGLDIDWDKLYGELKPRRISIPTYPFLRDRYWFDSSQTNISSNNIQRNNAPVNSNSNQSKDRLQELRALLSTDLTRFLEEAE